MLSEWELWARAQHCLSEHGEAPSFPAAMRCDELFDAGDYAGARTRRAVLAPINPLVE
jgi:hypothetical protein